ncbi:unnamed protein product [Caenorhabditis brenneri]
MQAPATNENSTPYSPEPSYDTDSSSSSSSSGDALQRSFESFSIQQDADEDSNFDMSFETIDDLVLEEMLEPNAEMDGSLDWPFPLPDVGQYWTNLMHEEETNGEEKGHDGDENIGGEQIETGGCATDEEITEFIVQEYKKTGKQLHPRGHLLWKKFGRRGDKSTTAMIKLFRTRISPRLPQLTLPKDLHMGLLKKARTIIGCEEKEALEKRHCVKIILNTKRHIETWTKEGRAQRGLVDYSDTSSSEAEM